MFNAMIDRPATSDAVAAVQSNRSKLLAYDGLLVDIGNVLIECGPRYMLERELGLDSHYVDRILNGPLRKETISRIDRGESFNGVVNEQIERFAEFADTLKIYRDNWYLTMGRTFDSVSHLLHAVIKKKPVYGVSNWPSEKVHLLYERIPILHDFHDIIFSGDIGYIKPERRFFECAAEKFKIDDSKSFLFIDDLSENVASGRQFGFSAYHFVSELEFIGDFAG